MATSHDQRSSGLLPGEDGVQSASRAVDQDLDLAEELLEADPTVGGGELDDRDRAASRIRRNGWRLVELEATITRLQDQIGERPSDVNRDSHVADDLRSA